MNNPNTSESISLKTVKKLDLTKEDKAYYTATSIPEIRDLDSYHFLSLSGKCAPEDKRFTSAIETLYAVAYNIKFLCKGEDDDFVVPKLECHWFIDGGMEVQHLFAETPREEWCWKLLIRMPDMVSEMHYLRSVNVLKIKNPEQTKAYEQVNFELIHEGRCVQIMHVGSWEDERPSLDKIFQLVTEEGMKITGYHKEIYISDPSKVAEEKKKTILRYQVNG